jgi:hypothetical protein
MPDKQQGQYEHYIPWWPMGLSVALVAALLIGMLVLLPFYGRTEYQVGIYDLTRPAQMAALGRTDEGFFLYVQGPADLGGGGGGQINSVNPALPGHRVYLRTGPGAYIPLQRR